MRSRIAEEEDISFYQVAFKTLLMNKDVVGKPFFKMVRYIPTQLKDNPSDQRYGPPNLPSISKFIVNIT